MFDNLLKLVQENAGDAIINNQAIPNEKNNDAIQATAGGIMDQLKGLAANGGTENIMKLFQGGTAGNEGVISNMSSNIAGDLMSKFGIDKGQAGNIVQSIIPVVMNQLVSKTNNPNDSSFDIQGIIGSLTGGQTSKGGGGIFNTLKGLFSK
jgi:hypothetical protein